MNLNRYLPWAIVLAGLIAGLLAQGVALWGTGRENTFLKSAGVNRGTTGEAGAVRHLEPKS